jgi:hypothetical protein
VASNSETDLLDRVAQSHRLSSAMTLGLSAGIYFEYYRRPQPSPTRFITGLQRSFPESLRQNFVKYEAAPEATLRTALRENAMWFIYDRQPTTALLGIEMLAEELVYYDTVADWRVCWQAMARQIFSTRALFRRDYGAFLQEISNLIHTQALASELNEIAEEWERFAAYLEANAAPRGDPSFETASRLVRRIAFREEHFWGKVLDL